MPKKCVKSVIESKNTIFNTENTENGNMPNIESPQKLREQPEESNPNDLETPISNSEDLKFENISSQVQ